jgi:regulator of microtubule dynamics protein 3
MMIYRFFKSLFFQFRFFHSLLHDATHFIRSNRHQVLIAAAVVDTLTAPTGSEYDEILFQIDRDRESLVDRRGILQLTQELNEKYPHRAEILIRLARAYYDLAEAANYHEKKESLKLGLISIEEAEKLGSLSKELQSQVYRWKGIILGSYSKNYSSLSDFIRISYQIHDLFLKALELNPSDESIHHLLGRWCYDVSASNITPFKRYLLASTVGSPPKSTMSEALRHFILYEESHPNTWIKNQLYIAKTELAMDHREPAKRWLISALSIPVKTPSDALDHQEARKLLEKL